MWRSFSQFLQVLRKRQHHRDLWRIARTLTPLTLKAEEEDDLGFSAEDLFGERTPPRFLGYYSEAGIERALRAYQFYDRLGARGFTDIRVSLQRDDTFTSTLRVYGVCGEGCARAEHLVNETRCRLMPLPRPSWLPPEALREVGDDAQAVRIEWMLLQNPCEHFTDERPQLPGQKHPGLGLGREVMELLRILGWRLKVAAFFINPYYVHSAILYSRKFVFFEPEDQGWFLALVAAAGDRSLCEIALAVQGGYLKDGHTDESVEWPARPQISPLSRPLIRLYRSQAYEDAALRACDRTSLRFDWEAFDREVEVRPRLPEFATDASAGDINRGA